MCRREVKGKTEAGGAWDGGEGVGGTGETEAAGVRGEDGLRGEEEGVERCWRDRRGEVKGGEESLAKAGREGIIKEGKASCILSFF